MTQPTSKSNTLVFGENPSIAIVSLWTPVEMVAKRLEKKNYGIIGNLYSAERGLDALVRSLLANPEIKFLVVTGTDMANSGQVLWDFFHNGFSKGKTKDTGLECWRVNSAFEGYIESDIPQTALEELRGSITVVRWNLMDPFESLLLSVPAQSRKKRVFEKKAAFVKKFFSEPSGFLFRSTGFLESWLLSLDSMLKFGHKTEKEQKLFHTVFSVSFDSKKPLAIPVFFPFSLEECNALAVEWSRAFSPPLLAQHLKKQAPWPVTFSFSNQPTTFFVQENDELLEIQAAVPSLNVLSCAKLLASLQALVESDSFKEFFPKTVVSLTVLDYNIPLEEIERAREWVQANYQKVVTPVRLLRDWRGNFVVYISHGEIVVEHVSPNNELLYMYTGKTALELHDQLMKEAIIGTIPHAVYLGTELQKAEIALKLGLSYVQDQPLDFSKKE